MLLTIIIPVYNVERYVGRCLESVFTSGAAGNADVEVIVVNDGTPDGSMAVVEPYAAKHDNLIIINQENAGLSEARNAGLRIARGKYIWFIDSDDYVSDTAVKEMLKIADEHDEEDIVFDTWTVYEDGSKQTRTQPLFVYEWCQRYYGQVHDGFFYHPKVVGGLVQRHLFMRTFLFENDLFFIPGLLHEDIEYMTHVFAYARTVLTLQKKYYYYIVRSGGSITTTFNVKRFNDMLYMIRLCIERGDKATDKHVRAVYHDAACKRSYKMLYPRKEILPEHAAFLAEHKKELKRNIIRSYFRSLRINDWHKTSYLLVTALGISSTIDNAWAATKKKIVG